MAKRCANNLRASRAYSGLGLVVPAFAVLTAAVIIRTAPGDAPAAASLKPAVVVPAFESVSLPVPIEPVAAGARLRDVRWNTAEYPKHQVPQGAITDISQYFDGMAAAPLPANLPVFEQNISMGAQSVNPVIEKIPAGMRAMTLRVDATTAVEGWAGSGSFVDVLLIAKDRTTVVAEKVKILSAERSVSPVEGTQTPSIPSTVTLLVSQEQCLAINTAIPLGKIAFALRSVNDEENWMDPIYTSDQLRNRSSFDNSEHVITGYVAVRGGAAKKAYALTDGKWIETEVKPIGFFPKQLETEQVD